MIERAAMSLAYYRQATAFALTPKNLFANYDAVLTLVQRHTATCKEIEQWSSMHKLHLVEVALILGPGNDVVRAGEVFLAHLDTNGFGLSEWAECAEDILNAFREFDDEGEETWAGDGREMGGGVRVWGEMRREGSVRGEGGKKRTERPSRRHRKRERINLVRVQCIVARCNLRTNIVI